MRKNKEMTKTTFPIYFPDINPRFDKNLLFSPTVGFKAEKLLLISSFLLRKINRPEFARFADTIKTIKQKYEKFMELYEIAKIKEMEAKGKEFVKTKTLFYRPRLSNRNDQRLFERLNNRAKASTNGRKRNEVQKI